jgi:hypothetical protein
MQLHKVLCNTYDSYNIIFKIKNKVYIASGSAPPPPTQKFWVRTCPQLHISAKN